MAAVYDVLLCPFVLYAVAAALRLADTPAAGDRAPAPCPARRRLRLPGASGTRGTPRLRLSEARPGRRPDRRGRARRGRVLTKREPRLKLGHGGSPGASSLGAAFTTRRGRQGQVRDPAAAVAARGELTARRRGRAELQPGRLPAEQLAVRPVADGPVPAGRLGVQPVTLGAALAGPAAQGRPDGPVLLPGPVVPAGPFAAWAARRSLGRSSSGWAARRQLAARPRRPGPLARPAARRPGTRPAVPPGPLARLAAALRRPARHQPRLRPRQAAFRQPIGPVSGPRLAAWLVPAARPDGTRPGRRADAGPANQPRPGCTCDVPGSRGDGGQEVTGERVVAPPSRAGLRARGRHADIARRQALLPAGDEQQLVHQAGRAEPDQGRDRARGPRPDPRRRRRPAGHQHHGPGRLGGHDDPGPAARRRRRPCCAGWPRCWACRTRC